MHKEFPMEKLCYFCLYLKIFGQAKQNVKYEIGLDIKMYLVDILTYNYLAHQKKSVEDNEKHDEVFEGRGGDEPPDVVADTDLGLGDIHFLGLHLNYVRYTGFLK